MSALRHAELDVHNEHVRLGYRCGNCAACYPEAAASWHDDARAGRLRAAVVGGLPLDLDPTAVGSPVSRPAAGHPLAGWAPGELVEAYGR